MFLAGSVLYDLFTELSSYRIIVISLSKYSLEGLTIVVLMSLLIKHS